MKAFKGALALVLCLLLTLTAVSALAQAPFTYADVGVSGIAAGATPAQVESVLGAPASKEACTMEAATGASVETSQYGSLTLTYRDGALSSVTYGDAAFAGPCGIRIGDAEETVKAAFP